MSTSSDLRAALLAGAEALRAFVRDYSVAPGAPVSELIALLDGQTSAQALPWGAALLAASGQHAKAIERWEQWLEHAEAPAAWHLAQLARSYERMRDVAGVFRTAARFHPWDLEAEPRAAAGRLLKKVRASAVPEAWHTRRAALLSTFTLDAFEPHLRLAAATLGVDLELYIAPFDTLRSEIVDPSSSLYAHAPEIVFLATSWRDVTGEDIETQAHEWSALWETVRSRSGAHVLQHNFDRPAYSSLGHLDGVQRFGRRRRIAELNSRLADLAPAGVTLVDYDQLVYRAGATQWTDTRQWHWAKEAVAQGYLPHLAEEYAAVLRALWGLTRKVLVLDLDNTLWGGVVGEDGVANLQLGPPSPEGEAHQALQQYAKELSSRGVLLAVCTKNNPEDARAPFLESSDMLLALDDFVAFDSSWEPKPEAIRRIARRLDLGLDSFVFVDDNPVERAAVRTELREVLVVPMPIDPAGFVEALHLARAFEVLTVSEEDRIRTASYHAEEGRRVLQEQVASPDAFLRSLAMMATVRPFRPSDVTRIVQLAARSNQFNLTTWRLTTDEVASLMSSSTHVTATVRLRDRFGDYGLVLVLIAQVMGDALDVRAWFMSCRVLGRRMEELALWWLDRAAAQRGCRVVSGHYLPTKKNVLVKDLYSKLGFERAGGRDADEIWQKAVVGLTPPELVTIDEESTATAGGES
jgi:FkbH-like protein